MNNKWLIIPAILISLCIGFTIFHGIEMNRPESVIERHRVVSIMDDGNYLMESPDGELYIFDGDLQNVEPGNYIIIRNKTEGSLLGIVIYIILGVLSIISFLALLALASDT